MKVISVLTALLAGVAFAVPTISDPGFTSQVDVRPPQPMDATPDNQAGPVGTSVIAQTTEPDYCLTTGSPGAQEPLDNALQLRPFMDWGDDVLIDNLADLPTQGKIATDVEADGTIWMGILDPDPGSTNDTVFHYYSTDGGESWTFWSFIAGPSGDIRDFDLVVGEHGGTVYVYTFVVYEGTGGLYCRWLAATDNGSFGWTQIQGGDTIAEVSADRNIETPQHVFVGWTSQGGMLRLESSNDGCHSFANRRSVAIGARNPAVCAGADAYVYIANLELTDSTFYWVGRYTNNLVSPTFKFTRTDSSGTIRHHRVSVAAARTAPGGSQVAMALTNSRWTTNGNLGPRYAHSLDGGENWSASFWPPTNQSRTTWDARWPYVRNSYEGGNAFRAVVTMHEPTESWDTLVYAFSRNTSPTDWEDRDVPNDHRITGEYGGKADYSENTDAGGFVVYREYAEEALWCDGWNFLGVEENGTPVAPGEGYGVATFVTGDRHISLNLQRPGRVRATLYDGTGRVAAGGFNRTLEAGRHQLPIGELSRGLYFLELDINGSTHTTKIVRLD